MVTKHLVATTKTAILHFIGYFWTNSDAFQASMRL